MQVQDRVLAHYLAAKGVVELAELHRLKSVAFCCISTGEFLYPHQQTAQIACETVSAFLKNSVQVRQVVFNVFQDVDYQIYQRQLSLQ